MNERKAYASPAVLTEDLLEQTSLACNATVSAPPNDPNNFAPGAGQAAPNCAIDVSKNNAFATPGVCQTLIRLQAEVVALS